MAVNCVKPHASGCRDGVHHMRVHTMTMTLEAIRDNSALKEIALSQNDIGDQGGTLVGARVPFTRVPARQRARVLLGPQVAPWGFDVFVYDEVLESD